MKKRLAVLFVMIPMMFGMVGCNNTPDGMNEKTYESAVKALEIMEKYNAGDITCEEASDRLGNIDDYLDTLELSDEGEYMSEADYNVLLQTKIMSCNTALYGITGDPYTAEDNLREFIN